MRDTRRAVNIRHRKEKTTSSNRFSNLFNGSSNGLV